MDYVTNLTKQFVGNLGRFVSCTKFKGEVLGVRNIEDEVFSGKVVDVRLANSDQINGYPLISENSGWFEGLGFFNVKELDKNHAF